MLIDKVTAWLTNPEDYFTGIELLKETGCKAFTLSILVKSSNPYNWGRVKQELRSWLEKQTISLPTDPAATRFSKENSEPVKFGLDYGVPGAKVVVMPKILPKSPELSGFQSRAEEPIEVLSIRQETGRLMNARADAVATIRALEHLGNSDEACAKRYPYACTVKRITRQLDELFSRLTFFEENGYLPPLATDQALVIDENRALLNARSSVSKYKAKLKKKNLTPEQRQSAEKLLKQYSEEKARLELKLSKHNDSHKTGQQETNSPNNSPAFPPT